MAWPMTRARHYAEALALTVAATTFAHGLGRLLALHAPRSAPIGLDTHITENAR